MSALVQAVIGALVAVLVGALADVGWPGYLMGAVLALSLWVMLFAGSLAGPTKGRVETVSYAAAAVVALVISWVVSGFSEGLSWWAVGFVMAGATVPSVRLALSPEGRGGG